MNEFHNKLIKSEQPYKNGVFVEIPNYKKQGSAFVLVAGIHNDIVIDENTSAKQIRKGRYTKLIEISTASYLYEVRINSISKENAYSFEVYIKAVIQVKDPIKFYENRNLDVDAYFENLFSMDVRKITRKYSILEYEGMDEELVQKLSSISTEDEDTGFQYRISAIDAIPGMAAQEYVNRVSEQQLEAEIKKKARDLSHIYTSDYEEAIMAEVVEGKITEAEAILKVKEYKEKNILEEMNRLEDARRRGFFTDKQVKDYMKQSMGIPMHTEQTTERTRMHEFYEGEEDE